MSTLTIRTLDPIEVIRSRPEMYLWGCEPTGDVFATRLVGDILLVTEAATVVRHAGDWWLVACEDDWLSRDPRWSDKDYFARVVPFPEAGVNSMHAEVLLTAFAQDAVSGTPVLLSTVKGDGADDSQLQALVQALPTWKRLIGFRMPGPITPES